MSTHTTVREWGDNHNFRKRTSNVVSAICVLSGILVVLPLALVFIYLVIQGAASVNWNFFTQLPKPSGELGGGMANAIVGTFTLLAIASLIGVPIGILGAVYLAEYGSPKLNWWIRFSSDILNGVPSIIWGIVIYGLMVVPMKGYSALAGGVALGCLMIPIILRTTEEGTPARPAGLPRGRARAGHCALEGDCPNRHQDRQQGHHHGAPPGVRTRGRGDGPAAFHRARQQFLESEPAATHLGAAPPDLLLCHLGLRRLSPPGLGRRAGARHFRFRP